MKTANVIALSFLLLLVGSVPAVAAPSSPCQTADRNVLDAIQSYQSAVRSVPTQCSKGATTCTTALTTAYDALVTVEDAHTTMANTCTVKDPPPPPPPPSTDRSGLILNEVDYNQSSTDTAEFVEIFNARADAVTLDGIAVVFINGATNTEYLRVNLSGSLSAGGYGVIVPPSGTVTVDPGALVFYFAGTTDIIQNGDPDGIAIVDTNAGTVLDALSYRGEITGAVITGISGTVNLVEGTRTTATDAGLSISLIRWPNGVDTNIATDDWMVSGYPTPGYANH